MSILKQNLYNGCVAQLQGEGLIALVKARSEFAKDSPDPAKIVEALRAVNDSENVLSVLREYIAPTLVPRDAPQPRAAAPAPPPAATPVVVTEEPAPPDGDSQPIVVNEKNSSTFKKSKKARTSSPKTAAKKAAKKAPTKKKKTDD